jgi:hypothetical protein
MWTRGKEHLVWQAGRLETYQNTILGLFSAIMKKNGKSFGRLQALALAYYHHGQLSLSLAFPPIDVGEENSLWYWRLCM